MTVFFSPVVTLSETHLPQNCNETIFEVVVRSHVLRFFLNDHQLGVAVLLYFLLNQIERERRKLQETQ